MSVRSCRDRRGRMSLGTACRRRCGAALWQARLAFCADGLLHAVPPATR